MTNFNYVTMSYTTKYHGPTNTKGARISVRHCSGDRKAKFYPYDHAAHNAHHSAIVEHIKDVLAYSVPAERIEYTSTKHGYIYFITMP